MENLVSMHHLSLLLCLIFAHSLLLLPHVISAGDAEALLSLKSSIDISNLLHWQQGTDVCNWEGIQECVNGKVRKLVLEHLNLTGTLDDKILNQLDELRVLSFKDNSLSGQIPDMSKLVNLKVLYLNDNNFSGRFPESITGLQRLKTIVLSGNNISGDIPSSLLNLPKLYMLYLEDNSFTGRIPPLNQQSLTYLNLSNNQLVGNIPSTPSLVKFTSSSFAGNHGLCGDQVDRVCDNSHPGGPSLSPAFPSLPETEKTTSKGRLIPIIAGTVGAFLAFLVILFLIWFRYNGSKKSGLNSEAKIKEAKLGSDKFHEPEISVSTPVSPSGTNGIGGNCSENQRGSAWQNDEGPGQLVFLGAGDQQMSYSLEDLLKASAETLGRGTLGCTYKALMESGFIVTVKRLKDTRYPPLEEFRRHMDFLGRLGHPNLVALRAYFQAKEERLLMYDYFPNGSLFSLIHGSRAIGSGKPLHWTSCLKIAEDVASGLFYIHQNPGLTHGNLKSSKVLFGADFESCLTDYGLSTFHDPNSLEEPNAAHLFHKAPECKNIRGPSTQPADVYSFGVLILELLTGKSPCQEFLQELSLDIPRWVRSIREEETESGDEPTSGTDNNEDKLQALVNIAMACVAFAPQNRPAMREVLKMIKDARTEAQGSSNSSDHSPGTWSDTIHSFLAEEHSSI